MPVGGEQYGAWYDHAAAEAAVAFFPTYLRHTEAQWWGQPFHLAPWQAKIVRTVFGWKRADGTRLIRELYLEVPRKNGKTEFAAGLSILMLIGDGEFGGQVYSAAVDKDQAKIVFNKASVMVGLCEELMQAVEVYKTSLYCPELAASFKPLSAKPGSKHGFSPSGGIYDEIHEWPSGDLQDVVHKGAIARRQPLEVYTTTAGEHGKGYGWEVHERAVAILKGEVIDPTFLPVIFAADPEDDWTDPATWAKANPGYGVSVKADFLKTECANAQGKLRKEADFKRFHLNMWVDQVITTGLPMDKWDACRITPVTLAELAGRPCWGGLDLSTTTDLTALCLVSPKLDGSGYDVWWRFWLPVSSDRDLRERCKRDRVDFAKWIAEGWIRPTEGNTVDYDVIRAEITGQGEGAEQLGDWTPITEMVDLKELAIDRWNSSQITTQLTNDGVTMVPFGQGYASMSAPSKEFERLIIAGELNHGGNPVARWMATCVAYDTDGRDNIAPVKPDRRGTPKRIDGIVAGTMAVGRAMVAEPGGGGIEVPEDYEVPTA
ncbi:terminase large subunit [Azospirillum formosense]|uniref:Terminase large subunit n=2 Tax=Azospirillum formosense TaxID=861533 RepID=A0ABX2KRU3_9PROT|nr:terminase TerL endonuclease subunit [Azospirillum formosense]MBY3752489.1 terminase large subunit [Azospirillum formosense]NUB18454.1 terminase large subunit [Azospirillum formosense]